MAINLAEVEKGTQLPPLEKGPITEIDLVRYAGASGDFNPIHVVPRVARFVGLEDGVIAHGMLIMAYAGQMLTDWAGVDSVQRLKVRFSGMTKPGDTVVCRGRITKKEEVDEVTLLHGRLTVKGKEEDDLRLKGDFTLRLKG
jgi:acyl dehydratase